MGDEGRVDVVVEIPRGSRNKYEYDEERQIMRLDRRIIGSVAFPADYGFVPRTTGADGDPLDALVLLDEPTFPGVWVAARAIGVSWIGTDAGREAKLLCVALGDPAYDEVTDIDELPHHVLREIGQFFSVYEQLEERSTVSDEGQEGRAAALRVLEESSRRWQREQATAGTRPASRACAAGGQAHGTPAVRPGPEVTQTRVGRAAGNRS
ncbi:inorganic diphosphatase [Geodermatophilus marinus]|uniref:inorganic diphosphatase n=1 Tax=Geodermatophilus sp. LHW52908 TaxID=2303986 RepID=UPI000E3E3154|nr:inorganic diphosphatase [Geodermatophilus sp. LHW52908]RFU18958.1 inorganic diphosphatase [Geodermatophilus sp. LHW52908]